MDIDLSGFDRKAAKVTQLVLKYDAKTRKKFEKELLAQSYRAEKKEDGLFAHMVVVDGQVISVRSRTGNELVNLDGLCERVEDAFALKGAHVIMGEVVNPETSLEQLGAMIKSSRKKPLSKDEELAHVATAFVAFDMVTLDEFNVGTSDTPSQQRREYLEEAYDIRYFINGVSLSEVIEWKVRGHNHIDALATVEIEDGEEGIVVKANLAPWESCRRTHLNFKIVSGVDFDLRCIGYEMGTEGTKREGMVANLIMQWKPYGLPENEYVELVMDGRATDVQRKEWAADPTLIVDKIFHVHGLCVGSKGSIRLVKFHEIRIDKDIADL